MNIKRSFNNYVIIGHNCFRVFWKKIAALTAALDVNITPIFLGQSNNAALRAALVEEVLALVEWAPDCEGGVLSSEGG